MSGLRPQERVRAHLCPPPPRWPEMGDTPVNARLPHARPVPLLPLLEGRHGEPIEAGYRDIQIAGCAQIVSTAQHGPQARAGLEAAAGDPILIGANSSAPNSPRTTRWAAEVAKPWDRGKLGRGACKGAPSWPVMVSLVIACGCTAYGTPTSAGGALGMWTCSPAAPAHHGEVCC